MEIALIHKGSLELGPFPLNVRYINSELEDLGLEDRISDLSFRRMPIHFSDELTHLVCAEKIIPEYDPKYYNLGNFTWEIVEEETSVTRRDPKTKKIESYSAILPVKVLFRYSISEKTLDEVKNNRKNEISPERKRKENTSITVNVNGVDVIVSTTREERILLTTKLTSLAPGATCNYKFQNTWAELSAENLNHIISQIDVKVQESFDWEFSKRNEVDSCSSIDEVYNVEITNVNNPIRGPRRGRRGRPEIIQEEGI